MKQLNRTNAKAILSSFGQNQKYHLYLFTPSLNFNVTQYISRLFTITTTNGSYKFNIEFMKDTSSLIKHQLAQDPQNLRYYLPIENGDSIIKRIEQLFLGETVNFKEDEEELFFKVIETLQMEDSFNFRKRNSFSPKPKGDFKKISFYGHRFENGDFNLQINKSLFELYFKSMKKTFTIVTKSKEYKCNIIGANSSKVINDFLTKNPNSTRYEYDYENVYNEFQFICDFFNFQKVPITNDNMNSLKTISEDLQIDIVMKDIDDFIDNFEKRIQVVDDQQSIIDSICELFETLISIKEKTVESVKDIIINSNWCKTEENVQELAAFIIQIIRKNSLLHPYLADLIELLSKEADESNKLEILVPFIIKKLINLGKNKFITLFIFLLYKRGIIQKDEILKNLKSLNSSFCKVKKTKKSLPFKIRDPKQFSDLEIFEKYQKIINDGEPDDPILKALRNDDVDTFQSIISMNNIDFTNQITASYVFDKFSGLSYIDYSAAYGSIRCFKYLLLNHAKLNESSFKYAIFGGNIEIIKIIDQKFPDLFTKNSVFGLISFTIKKHQYDLFDWIFEQKYTNAIKDTELVSNILLCASKNGDIHSIAAIVDKGYDFEKLDNILCCSMIKNAAENGFCKLLEFISIVVHKKMSVMNFDPKASASFGNLSIFKFFKNNQNNLNLHEVISISIENESRSIFKYIFNNFPDLNFDDCTIYRLLCKSINLKTKDTLEYLIKQFKKIRPKFLSKNSDHLIGLLSEACYIHNIEMVKLITDLIIVNYEHKNVDFSLPFFNAAVAGSSEICQFLIDKKVSINFYSISLQVNSMASINKDIFDIIIKNASEKVKENFIYCYLDEVIRAKNKFFIEYLLNEKAFSDNALFEAVETNDIEIVNMILNSNSDPLFINQVSEKGTALHLAVSLNNLEILKSLISIPGIDPNLYEGRAGNTPLINAIYSGKIEMAKLLIELDSTDINRRNFSQETALSVAANKKNTEIVKLLINNKKFDPIQSRLNFVFTTSNEEVSKILITHKDLDVNYKNYSTANYNYSYNNSASKKNIFKDIKTLDNQNDLVLTPLTRSVIKSRMEMIDIIINHPQFDPVKSLLDEAIFISCKINDYNNNNVNIKTNNSNINFFKKLVKINDNNVNIKDNNNGKFLIDVAIEKNNDKLVAEILNNEKFDSRKCDFYNIFIKCFTSFPINFNILNLLADYDIEHEKFIDYNNCLPNGKSFFTAIKKNYQTDFIVSFLLKKGADPNKPDKLGFYPLEYAIKHSNTTLFESLIDSNKIDFSVKLSTKNKYSQKELLKDIEYTTYLHLAIIYGNKRIISLFFDKKLMDINVTDSNGETPLMLACRTENTEVIDILFKENNLDYLHCNNDGDDSIAILNKIKPENKINPTKDRKEYHDALKPKSSNETKSKDDNLLKSDKNVKTENNLNKIKQTKSGFTFADIKNIGPINVKNENNKEQPKNINFNFNLKDKDGQSINPKLKSQFKFEKTISLIDKNTSSKISHSEDVSKKDAEIQENITTSILNSLDNFTQDEAEKISKVLTSIVKKEVENITKKSKEIMTQQKEKQPKEIEKIDVKSKEIMTQQKEFEKIAEKSKEVMTQQNEKQQNQSKIETESINSKNINETNKDKRQISYNHKQRFLLQKSMNEDEFYEDFFEYDDQNQFDYQNQMISQQWNQMLLNNSMRNAQFNIIMQQHEQIARSLMFENERNSRLLKRKTKKLKKKNHK